VWNSLDAFCAGFVAVGDVVIMGAMNGKEVGSGTLSTGSREAIEARRSSHPSPVDPNDVATAIFVRELRGPIVIEKILEASAGSPEILWKEETRRVVYEAAHHKETATETASADKDGAGEEEKSKEVHGHFIARIGLECGFSLSEGLIGEFQAKSIEFESGLTVSRSNLPDEP